MTAIDPANDTAAETAHVAATQITRYAGATDDEVTPEDCKADEEIFRRIEHLPRDVGSSMRPICFTLACTTRRGFLPAQRDNRCGPPGNSTATPATRNGVPTRHVFSSVTLDVLDRLRDQDDGNYAVELDPGRIGGTLVKHTAMGNIVVRFDHNNERAEMTVTIIKKPMFLPVPLLLAEMSLALRLASDGGASSNTT